MKTSTCCNSKVIDDKPRNLVWCSRCCGITHIRYSQSPAIDGLLLVLLLFVGVSLKAPNVGKFVYTPCMAVIDNDVALSDSALKAEIVKQRFIFPDIVLAKIRLETGNYTSRVCLENKNLFGMNYHKSWMVIGARNGYAVYGTYKNSIRDYHNWEKWFVKTHSKLYSESDSYPEAILNMK